MGKSYRIKATPGKDSTLTINLDQDFETINILSLSIQQNNLYPQTCSDYGLIVGRVVANNGFGIPNAKVSVFVPLDSVDENNPNISSIYPFKSPTDVDLEGYRYNILPNSKSHSKHNPTGTFPSRNEVLTNALIGEVYGKYYKYTVKTNDSGDYMIMGVPQGTQNMVMDVDLSDIGEFSFTPQDLVRLGLATDSEITGGQFNSSTDLNSLPQIISLTKTLEVSPLWGDPELCQIAINRVDFDLRAEANVEIRPTAVFLGSLFSSPASTRLRPRYDYGSIIPTVSDCRPKDNLGNLCSLETGPGEILAIRHTIYQDDEGNPILEEYKLNNSGNVIDEDGTWIVDLPMNLDYVTTNEFGERIISNDPNIGIPTKAKYRFKVKWQQPNDLTEQTRRAYFLVPNVREYGWESSYTDPNYSNNINVKNKLGSSYYFGLNWSGYTNGFSGIEKTNRLSDAINCEDVFYEFNRNKAYTVSGLIDQYKKGGRARFIGIKEIDSNDCDNSTNKFPVNDAFRNFDLIFFLFSILIQLFQVIGQIILILSHIALFSYTLIITTLCNLCKIKIPIINVKPFSFICNLFSLKCETISTQVSLPMMTYPDCQACKCKDTSIIPTEVSSGSAGVLSSLSFSQNYEARLKTLLFSLGTPSEDLNPKSQIIAQAIAGNNNNSNTEFLFKLPKSDVVRFNSSQSGGNRFFAYSDSLPIAERINIFNLRGSYFLGNNVIKVKFAKQSNIGNDKVHFDNSIIVISNTPYDSGTILTTVDPTTSSDINFTKISNTPSGILQGITGTTITSGRNVTVKYANSQTSENTVVYYIPSGSTIDRQIYPMDREYFQVITAMTLSEVFQVWDTTSPQLFPKVISDKSSVRIYKHRSFPLFGYTEEEVLDVNPLTFFEDIEDQYLLILQRGVDPYSPLLDNEYSLGKLFGKEIDDPQFRITTKSRMNIPIQKLTNSNKSIENFVSPEIYHSSYFFTPGLDFSSFTSTSISYYSDLDSTSDIEYLDDIVVDGVLGTYSVLGNEFYDITSSSEKYDRAEDVSGGSYMFIDSSPGFSLSYDDVFTRYYTPNLYSKVILNPLAISNKVKNVMRSDRLPSSDVLNGFSWDTNPTLLQQNNNFQFYSLPDLSEAQVFPGFSTGAEQLTSDLNGLPNAANVFDTFSCENMVSLTCYSGFSSSFGIKNNCEFSDSVEKGCYVFLRRPLLDLGKDLKSFQEWGYRFRFFYGLCRGVLSQTFTNNWINGSLFAFPIQVDTYFDSKNQPFSKWCREVIYYDDTTNNFYYRSSPYNDTSKKFIGKSANQSGAANTLNLLYPTTIMNLGMKDAFFKEILLDGQSDSYVIPKLDSSSYSDTSDLVNLFVTSRITNQSYLGSLFQLGDNSIDRLFSRPDRKVDGDLAQLLSINSEIGVIKFSPESYNTDDGSVGPVTILGSSDNPILGVWFSSTTENLQTKDFISPGRINFRTDDNSQNYPYMFNIKSQIVPFYQWKLNSIDTIFGNQYNDWATTSSDIGSSRYQSLDRTSQKTPSYFVSNTSPTNNDTYLRGYMFSVDSDGNYSTQGSYRDKFIVGLPYQFYFGLLKGKSAINKFKIKYSVSD